MRGLLALVVGMGLLIVAGVATIAVTIVHRLTRDEASFPVPIEAVLDEPTGSRIIGVAAFGNRLALALAGGGPDRIVIVDPATGRRAGRLVVGTMEKRP